MDLFQKSARHDRPLRIPVELKIRETNRGIRAVRGATRDARDKCAAREEMDDGPGIIFTWTLGGRDSRGEVQIEIGGGTRILWIQSEKKPDGVRGGGTRNETGSGRKRSGGGSGGGAVCR